MEDQEQAATAQVAFPAQASPVTRLRETLVARIEQNARAWRAGVKARDLGLYRVSPFYEDPVSDEFFFAGFDGMAWENAVRGEFSQV